MLVKFFSEISDKFNKFFSSIIIFADKKYILKFFSKPKSEYLILQSDLRPEQPTKPVEARYQDDSGKMTPCLKMDKIV